MITENIKKHFKGDQIIWLVVVGLMLVSVVAVYTSTGSLAYAKRDGNTVYFVLKHIAMLLLGLGSMVFVHRVPPRYISGLANALMAISILSLAAVQVVGSSTNGASRWLNLGFFSFQPSEFAKIALIVFVARHLALHQHEPDARKAFKPIMIGMLLVCGLIFKDNLSTFLLTAGTCMILMFIGRVPLRYLSLAALVGVGLLTIMLLTAPVLAPHVPMLKRLVTWNNRIERFFSDEKKVSEGDFQLIQAQKAIATGGIGGKGPGNSYYRNFLPMAFSDFIFAIILEEYGLWGGFIIVMAYVILMARAINIARKSERPFHIFLVLGLVLLLVFQAFINMGVCVGILPVTGQTLPLVSMGGTSNLFTGMAIGAILSVSRFNQEQEELNASEVEETV